MPPCAIELVLSRLCVLAPLAFLYCVSYQVWQGGRSVPGFSKLEGAVDVADNDHLLVNKLGKS